MDPTIRIGGLAITLRTNQAAAVDKIRNGGVLGDQLKVRGNSSWLRIDGHHLDGGPCIILRALFQDHGNLSAFPYFLYAFLTKLWSTISSKAGRLWLPGPGPSISTMYLVPGASISQVNSFLKMSYSD